MEGRIIKGIAGFYYVETKQKEVYECKAKGNFRNKKIKPLVGDFVNIQVLSKEEKTGNIIEIFLRKNELIRPAVANIDQVIVIFATADPNPNFNLLDRFLMMMTKQEIPSVICFNKMDKVDLKKIKQLHQIYESCGSKVMFTSTYEQKGIDEIRALLKGKVTALAGPSGVGKSSMLNSLLNESYMETGNISEKIKRGKHTTRHSELIPVGDATYVVDTPGFTSLFVEQYEKEEVKDYFPEFLAYQEECRFQGCIHINEPDCAVKLALEQGKISENRYNNYKLIYQEVSEKRKRR